MFKMSEIKELIKLVDQTSINELEVENDGARLSIRKPGLPEASAVPVVTYAPPAAAQAPAAAPAAQPAAAQPAAAEPARENLHQIVSPMVGTFYHAASPGAAPFIAIGDKVGEKTVVCIVEAMKLMNEIEAEVKGTIADVLVENGQLVEYGQPLFLVKTEA